MIQLTKIVHFEMAHAIHCYNGVCKNIHGHSYELHVTIASLNNTSNFLPPPGFFLDFKELNKLIVSQVINKLDHTLILSRHFLNDNPIISSQENLVILDFEPSAENLLLYIRDAIQDNLPTDLQLAKLRLYETKNSYAEWSNDN